jgi:hypothetical protein
MRSKLLVAHEQLGQCMLCLCRMRNAFVINFCNLVYVRYYKLQLRGG